MDPDGLEPIDLEPIDLEPVDGPRGYDDARFDRDRPRSRGARLGLLGVVAIAVAAWATIALTTQGRHQAVPPTPPPTSVPVPDATVPPHVDRIRTLAPHLWAGLQGLGSGRFAAVVDDRLYLLDRASTEAQATLVRLPEGHVTIDDQSGSSLLATTLQSTLVSTTSPAARVLPVRDVAIRAADGNGWWLLASDGTLRPDRGGGVLHEPDGIRVAAAVQNGFVAIDPPNSQWVFWAGPKLERLAPASSQLVGTGANRVVFRFGCSIYSCSIAIDDLTLRTTVQAFLTGVPEFAEFSPDGRRLAIASTLGSVWVLDTTTGAEVVRTQSRTSATASLPFTWTPDGRSLIVVGVDTVEIRRGSDGTLTGEIHDTAGLQQLVALP